MVGLVAIKREIDEAVVFTELLKNSITFVVKPWRTCSIGIPFQINKSCGVFLIGVIDSSLKELKVNTKVIYLNRLSGNCKGAIATNL